MKPNIKYAERLELAAKVIKENLEFQVYHDEGERWIIHPSENIGVFAQEDWEDYQIRLTPEQSYQPLELSDIEPGSAIRANKDKWFLINHVDSSGVYFIDEDGNPEGRDFLHLSKDIAWEIYLPSKKKWGPCKKLTEK